MKNQNYPLYEVEPVNDLKELVDLAAEKYGDHPAFTFERDKEIVHISYRQFKSDVDALGTALFNMGIKDAKVAVIGENSYEWILTYFAVVNSGNVIVPLDRELPPEDIEYLLTDSDANILVFSSNYADVADYMKNRGMMMRHYINMNTILSLLEKGNSLLRNGEKSIVDYKINDMALAAILYTSGTTGMAKGVMLSHQGIVNNAIDCSRNNELLCSNLQVLPLHHSFGFISICVMLIQKTETCINSSLKNVLADLDKFKPINIVLVPLFVETFYKKIWDTAKKQQKDKQLRMLIKISNAMLKTGIDMRRQLFKSVLRSFGGNLRFIVCGGAPLDEKYVMGFRDFGIYIMNGYGITECSPIVSANRNYYYRDGSVGLIIPGVDVKIMEPDESGHGEICVNGDIVMLGYFKNEQATREAFDDEWFKTGDIGYLDDDGFLFISGRKKNVIILSNGKNVYPEELEFALLNQIPYIKETVVYAESNLIVAEVFLDTENDSDCVSRLDGDILQFNKTQAPYKNISRTVIRETEFPKTTTQKIKRQK